MAERTDRERRRESQARLDQPREVGRRMWRPSYDDDLFGRFAERFARFMGTAQFLLYMTVFIIVWILINVFWLLGLHWDPYPFILLNLFFSTQASYAAPLILLAQNRQADRDRVTIEQDRARDERNLADTEFLTREVAALRIAMRDSATRDFVRSELRGLLEEMEERGLEIAQRAPQGAARADDEQPDRSRRAAASRARSDQT